MDDLTAEHLLSGPRGRGVCMAVAHRLDYRVWSAWLHSAWNLEDKSLVDDLVRVLGSAEPEAVRGWREPGAFVDPVGESVGHAMYWQAPRDQDLAAADPAVITALRPIAEAIDAAPASGWWSDPVDLEALRHRGPSLPEPPKLYGASDRLRRWREHLLENERDARTNRPADPAAPYSGVWWSTPAMASLVTTARPLPGLGSVELPWQEDDDGLHETRITTLSVAGVPRVYEVDRPEAWVSLVRRYPLEVTYSRRHDWYRTTGRAGAWFIPDWSAVAADWDAVHVSVAGYLMSATRALSLGDRAATMLAGWNPDQTYWLTDILSAGTSTSELWHRDETGNIPNSSWHLGPQ